MCETHVSKAKVNEQLVFIPAQETCTVCACEKCATVMISTYLRYTSKICGKSRPTLYIFKVCLSICIVVHPWPYDRLFASKILPWFCPMHHVSINQTTPSSRKLVSRHKIINPPHAIRHQARQWTQIQQFWVSDTMESICQDSGWSSWARNTTTGKGNRLSLPRRSSKKTTRITS